VKEKEGGETERAVADLFVQLWLHKPDLSRQKRVVTWELGVTRRAFSFLPFVGLAMLSAPIHAETPVGDPAAAQIISYTDALLAVMKQGKALKLTGRYQAFLPLIGKYYDIPAMTGLIVGPRWAQASPSERAAASDAFARYSAMNHATNFTSYTGQHFTIDPKVESRGGDRLVRVMISGGGDAVRLGYRLRARTGNWRIIDVYAEGVSQLATQRSDVAATVAKGGAALLAKKYNEAVDRALAKR